MAENSESRAREKDSLLGVGQRVPQNSQASSCNHCKPRTRKVRSKGATVVLVWTYLMFTAALNPAYQSVSLTQDLGHYSSAAILGTLAGAVIGPFAGLVASIYFVRYKMLCAALWLTWVAKSATVPILILQRLLPGSSSSHVSFSYGVMSAELFSWIGVAFFVVNVIPFGLDQMPDANGEQISAFIHWYAWTVLTGITTKNFIADILDYARVNKEDVAMILSIVSVASLSVALCSVFISQKWLTVEPCGVNPLITYFRVVVFAAKHRIPVRRSAFTYWEAEMPSRIDLGKSKYGGPFTTEEVEDLKTCLRILLVMVTSGTLGIVFPPLILSLDNVLLVEVQWKYLTGSVAYQAALCIMLSPPVYEVTPHPLVRRWLPTTMKRAGAAKIMIAFVNVVLLLLTTVQYMKSASLECMLATSEPSPFPIDRKWIALPAEAITCYCIFCFVMAALEFVCAQAPYNMRGLLTGLVHTLVFLCVLLGAGIYAIWTTKYQDNIPSCGVWFYLFTTITATLGCVLWCVVAKWYKRREREEPDMCRIFAENYYEK